MIYTDFYAIDHRFSITIHHLTGLGHRIEHHLRGDVEERDVGSLECQAPAKGRRNLHQLKRMVTLSHYLKGFNHPFGGAGFLVGYNRKTVRIYWDVTEHNGI